MKRLLTTAALFLCSLLTFAQFSGSGSGTENDPYLILNPIQLNQLRNFLDQRNVYFKLMSDIDITEFIEGEYPSQGWMPIGTSLVPFRGIFDGNGKTITGLWINRQNSDYVGFFGCLGEGCIKNLKIEGTTVKGNKYVGLLVGYASNSEIKSCNIIGGRINGETYVGGCIGYGSNFLNSGVSGIKSSAEVIGRDVVGGIIGGIEHRSDNKESITECEIIEGHISGNNYVGGICGTVDWISNHQGSVLMSRSYVKADIFGNDNVGGICGKWQGPISYCGFVGSVTGNSSVGGICGYGTAGGVNVDYCFAHANILAQNDKVGGIGGLLRMKINNCYYSGSIVGKEMVGGLVGMNLGGIRNSYSNASIWGSKDVGGLCGKIGDTEMYSNIAILSSIKATEGNVGRLYGMKDGRNVKIGAMGTADENKAWNKSIVIDKGISQEVIDNEQNGTGVSANTLKLKATYVAMGFDFTDIWDIQETECYPYFRTQTAPPVITSQVVSGATTVSGKCIDGGTITLEIDRVKKQLISSGNTFSFTVAPLQAGHEVRVSAKAEGKEQSYYTTEVVSFLGKGTEVDPYQVSTAADLSQVYRKGYYKLMNDIDLTSYINQYNPTEGWESIGREGSETIHFDGNGHKITGLWCNSTRDNTGLFSCFANGYIKNLTVETAKGKQVKGGNYTGIIIGKLINGEMTNCKVTGSLADGTPVGGMMGKLDGGKVSRCQADVTINVSGENSYIGGLIGEQNGEVDQCLSYGTLTATGKTSYVGGLVGISNSGSNITNSYSSAVTNSSLSAAGIVAYNYGVVDKCYATGNVFSKNYGAGVVGYNDGAGAVVKNCVAMNNKLDVTYESQSAQSGGYGQRIIGGIKNSAPTPEMNNYALKTMQVSVNNVPQKVYDDIMNGTAKTAAQLKAKATYQELGWDFNSIWKIEEGSSYPYQTEIIVAPDSDEPVNPDIPDDDPETIGVTDISNLTNAIYAQPTSSQPGYETTLNICLKNAQGATAYSFDLQLPEGVTLATKSNGDYQYTLSNRHNGHSETVNYQSGSGVYSFAVLSLQSKELTGNDGAIWTLRLKVANNVANGDYAIKILNAKYSIASGSAKVTMPETVNKLTINQYKKGDVNNDGDVDIADAVCIVNHVVGIPTPSFVAQAADVNGDGDVDIADAVRIVNLVVGKIQALSRSENSPSVAATRASNSDADAIYAEDISVYAGENCTLNVSLKNAQATNAYSFDFTLPEGVSIATDEEGEYLYELSDRHNGHMSTLNNLGNNTYSFATLSLQSKEVKGNDGIICTFKLKVDKAIAGGKYAVTIKNAKYSLTSGASKVKMSESEANLTVKVKGDVNGDYKLDNDDLKAIVSYIMGKTPTGFDKDEADLNGDKKVNAADIVVLVNMIRNK